MTYTLSFFPRLLLGASLLYATAHAQPAPEWEQQITRQTTVTGMGSVEYFMAYRSAGFDHFEADIGVRWQSQNGPQEQTLYEGIHDRPPAKIWGDGPHLCLAMDFCTYQASRCSTQITAYRYDTAQQAFVSLKRAGKRCQRPR